MTNRLRLPYAWQTPPRLRTWASSQARRDQQYQVGWIPQDPAQIRARLGNPAHLLASENHIVLTGQTWTLPGV